MPVGETNQVTDTSFAQNDPATFDGSYTVRVHPRARRVLLKVVPHRGLEVVVPPGYDQSALPALVAARHEWISAAFKRLSEAGHPMDRAPLDLPDTIALAAMDRSWRVDTVDRPGPVRVVENGQRLLLRGGDGESRLRALREWVRRMGKRVLPPMVRECSDETGLQCGRVSVRLQRGRWGSCSTAGNLSLNAKMLFLPRPLAEHVILHELCHTAVMDHSRTFHALLRRHNPDAPRLERELTRAMHLVPFWMHA